MHSNIPDDIQDFIGRTFSTEEQSAVMDSLASAVIHDGSHPNPRLLRCAVVGSKGDMARFVRLIDTLRIDWRDVIVAGEYESIDGRLVQVRNLADPISS